jgi:hypothetical protein
LRGAPGPFSAGAVYRTLKDHLIYADPGADAYNAQDRTRIVRRLRQRAESARGRSGAASGESATDRQPGPAGCCASHARG